VNPEVHLKTAEIDIAQGVQILVAYLKANKYI
jgi:hypothetical protein